MAPDADRYALLRRLTLDVTGLLPTAEDVDRFVKDDSPAALETVVDRLLNSPPLGSAGDATGSISPMGGHDRRGHDGFRCGKPGDIATTSSESFANDKPYDRFLREQIAGRQVSTKEDTQRKTR